MRYHMYEDRIEELSTKIADFNREYQDILNNPPIGGSVVKMADGTVINQNIVMRLEYRLADLESNLKYYQERIKILDNWLGVLTEKQSKVAKMKKLKTFIMKMVQ